MPPHSTQEQGVTGSSDASSELTREKPLPPHPQARSTVRQIRRCPRCRKLNTGTDLSCYWCGTELPADTPAPANIAPPSFAGYAKTGGIRRKSRLPVLGILVIVLLLGGAGTGVWMLRSSLPSKPATAPSSVVVTISPASAQVVAGKAFDFSATVSGTDDTQVIWTVQEGDAGGRVVTRGAKAEGGTLSSGAVYIAPRTPGTYHLLATSKAEPRKSASAEATVTKR